MPVSKRLTGHLRGAAFVLRDAHDRVVGTVFSLPLAEKICKRRGMTFETVPNALTEKAIMFLGRTKQ